MPISAREILPFEPMRVLGRLLARSPELYLAAERSPLFRLLCSAHDPGYNHVYRDTFAEMWCSLFETHHEALDEKLDDPAPGVALHELPSVGLSDMHATLVGALTEAFDSVFEMFDLAAYEEVTRAGTVAVPLSEVLPPLFAFRPSLDELRSVDPKIRLRVIGLLREGFSVADAVPWYTHVRSQRSGGTYEVDRQRFAALRKLGVSTDAAVEYVLRFPKVPVEKMASAYRNGVTLEYAAAIF